MFFFHHLPWFKSSRHSFLLCGFLLIPERIKAHKNDSMTYINCSMCMQLTISYQMQMDEKKTVHRVMVCFACFLFLSLLKKVQAVAQFLFDFLVDALTDQMSQFVSILF